MTQIGEAPQDLSGWGLSVPQFPCSWREVALPAWVALALSGKHYRGPLVSLTPMPPPPSPAPVNPRSCTLLGSVCLSCADSLLPLQGPPQSVSQSLGGLSLGPAQSIIMSPGPGSDPLEWRVDEQRSPCSPTILFLADPGTAIRREMGVGVSLMKLPGLGQAGLG